MPTITDPTVIGILQDPYFIQHTAMHLSRVRVTLPDGTKLPLILPPCRCPDCSSGEKKADTGKPDASKPAGGTMAGAGGPGGMIEAGQPGSGLQLLQMHHEMIRVFRFLLENHKPPVRFLTEWPAASPPQPSDGAYYAPLLWDLDDPDQLPHEIVGMFQVTDPEYLGLVFAGVKRLVEAKDGAIDEAVDKLGRFIEQGVMTGSPDGSGFHDTIHAYLASREGRAAQGAEMNKLVRSRFNDYFWSLHLWIDAQYGRLLENRGQPFDKSGLDPKTLDMCTDKAAGGKMAGMSMAS